MSGQDRSVNIDAHRFGIYGLILGRHVPQVSLG
jgi:hypothetical protein